MMKSTIKKGSQIRVRRGVFEGLEGVVERLTKKGMLVANIPLIGMWCQVSICAEDAELLGDGPKFPAREFAQRPWWRNGPGRISR
jgi:hypothetical protein